MTQSDPKSLCDELLKQTKTGNEQVDAGLAQLRQLVEAEHARLRRLARWTRIVWIAAGACVVLGIIFPMIVYLAAQGGVTSPPGRTVQFFAPIAATLFFLGAPMLVVCIVVGIVLLILTILARRTAGMHEIRASLASIDAQLRVLAINGK